MRRYILVGFLILICFLLQSTVFQTLNLGGIVPNLLIILTASFGFMRGEVAGLLIGFICGLLCDICYGDVVGFQALIMMYIGYLNGKFSGIFYPEDVKLPMALIILSDFTFGVVNYVLLFLMRGRLDFPFYLKSIIIPEVIYTTIATIPLYYIIWKINFALETREKSSAQKFI